MSYLYWLTHEPCEANRARNPDALCSLVTEWYWTPGDFHPVPAPVCGVCGSQEIVRNAAGYLSPYRCWEHRARNPCAIEGCTRSRAAEHRRLANNRWFCDPHWRAYCPPRSARRRAYLAFWRKAKRYGWTPELAAQFNRFWDTLVANARAKAAGGGSINMTEINRLFGWE